MEIHREVLALKERFGLELLDTTNFEYRSQRWELIVELLKCNGNMLIQAPTGSGKTVMFLVKATQIFSRGGRAVLTTVRRFLADDQFVQQARKFTTLVHQEILAVTGEIPPSKRAELYQRCPKLILATREVILEDIRRETFVWDGIRLFGTDEIHHSQGNDAYTQLIPRIKELPIQRVHLSATAASDEPRLITLLASLNVDRTFILDPARDYLHEEAITVDLDDELTWAADIIRDEGMRCLNTIEHAFPQRQLVLFDEDEEETNTPVHNLPDFARRQRLRGRIEHYPNDATRLFLLSKWSELGLICWLWEALVTCGRFVFLEDFVYRYAKHRLIPPAVKVKYLEYRPWRGGRLFEKRAITNTRLWMVFATLARGTPYEAFVEESTWGKVLQSTMPENSSLLHELAVQFFDGALCDIAKRDLPDHPKIQPLLEIFHRHPQCFNPGLAIVFTGTRRHAQFLATLLNERLHGVGYNAVAAIGPKYAKQRRRSKQSLADFRSGQANILISTDYIREGLDVPLAQLCVEYCISDSNPIKKVQGRGRVGRDEMHGAAHLYCLLTRQSNETVRLLTSRHRMRIMRRTTKNRGLVLPYEVKGDIS